MADPTEGYPWSESAEIFFLNVIGDKARSDFQLVFDITRACCVHESIKRTMQKWPYVGRVEPQDVAAVIAYTGEVMSPEEIESWSS